MVMALATTQGEALSLGLVTLNAGVPVTTSLAIAEGTGTEHKAVIQLVRKYQTDLERFSLVTFEMAPRPEGQHGGGVIEYALLTQEQATLVLTYMRNNPVTRAFKIQLVQAFWALARQAQTVPPPMSGLQALQATVNALVEQDQRLTVAETRIERLEVYNEQAQATRKALSAQIRGFERIAEAAREQMNALPGPTAEVPELSTRILVNRVVRDYSFATHLANPSTVFDWLYREFRDRYHIDLRARASEEKKKGALDVAVDLGVIDQLYALALHLFRQ